MFEGTKPGNADKPHATAPVFDFLLFFSPYLYLASAPKINGPDFPFHASHFCWSRREVAHAIAAGSIRDLRHTSLY
jgi:hypothetical protein